MPAPNERHRTIRVVGLCLLVPSIMAFTWSRIATGHIAWLNYQRQPVTIFLFIPFVLILGTIAALDRLVWRRRREEREPEGRHKRRRR